jgi:hypothetical protein
MSSYTLTGEHVSQSTFRIGGFVQNTPSIGEGSELYTRPYIATAEIVTDTQKSRRHDKTGKVESSRQIADLQLFRVLLEKVSECAARLTAATETDYMERGTAGNELFEYLEELWQLRSLREREWQTLLALIQSSLHKVAFEEYTSLQCKCVQSLVTEYLTDSELTKERVAVAMRMMREARLDVWRGLSGSENPPE